MIGGVGQGKKKKEISIQLISSDEKKKVATKSKLYLKHNLKVKKAKNWMESATIEPEIIKISDLKTDSI